MCITLKTRTNHPHIHFNNICCLVIINILINALVIITDTGYMTHDGR